jgi:hypothetical protein
MSSITLKMLIRFRIKACVNHHQAYDDGTWSRKNRDYRAESQLEPDKRKEVSRLRRLTSLGRVKRRTSRSRFRGRELSSFCVWLIYRSL